MATTTHPRGAQARTEIAAAAEANGWTKDAKLSSLLIDWYRKGRRYVWAYYNLGGQVVDGTFSSGGRSRKYTGRDKRGQIIRELARQ